MSETGYESAVRLLECIPTMETSALVRQYKHSRKQRRGFEKLTKKGGTSEQTGILCWWGIIENAALDELNKRHVEAVQP